jgi:HAD superfamily hydrolase (TIGR01509 family)
MKKNIDGLKAQIQKTKSYIFDMDGTLVDLENLNFTTFQRIIKKIFQNDFTQAEFQQYFSGAGSKNGFTKYCEAMGLDYSVESLVTQYRAVKKDILHNEFNEVVTLKEGVPELLDELKSRGLKIGLATSSFHDFAKFIMTSFGLYDQFEIFLTERDVVNNKPHPEIFNKACELLGHSKEESIIFEDSMSGLKSAMDSEIFTIGIFNPGLNDNYIDRADAVIESYFEVLEALKSD